VEKYDSPRQTRNINMILRRKMRFACWITRAIKYTHRDLQFSILIVESNKKNFLFLENSAKRNRFCISVTTLNTFVLLTATFTPETIKMEHFVAFPLQQRLGKRTKI
jgi:hypothetical protein